MDDRVRYITVDGRIRRRLERDDDEVAEIDIRLKFAAAKASPSVVGILSRNLPKDMAIDTRRRRSRVSWKGPLEEIVYWGTGIIIESQLDSVTLEYFSTIITPATLFFRTNGVQPPDINVHVYLWNSHVCEAKVLACDFHYNLAALRIQSHSPLPTATLMNLHDVVSIARDPHKSFHSNLFKISPGTNLITLARSYSPLNHTIAASGVFWPTSTNAHHCYSELDCNHLYWVKDTTHPEMQGGAVINYLGQVIGLMFHASPFLPINIVSAWWKHFKTCGQYRRPWLGVEIANLHSTCSDYLIDFMRNFPNVNVGVVVTKVAEDSPAYCCGIRPKDVIVECDGKLVRSILEFFEIVWNKFDADSVMLDVLRAGAGETLKLRLTVKETSPDQFYQWMKPEWDFLIQTGN